MKELNIEEGVESLSKSGGDDHTSWLGWDIDLKLKGAGTGHVVIWILGW